MEIFVKKGKPDKKHTEGKKKKNLGVKFLKKGCAGSTTKPPTYSSGQQKASLGLYCESIEREGRQRAHPHPCAHRQSPQTRSLHTG